MNPSRIFLLSVGINNYYSDRISSLDGCVRDVSHFQQTLVELKKVTPERCQLLCNEEATRANIIQNFRTHFTQLEDGDTAVFHFSGHGSQRLSHPLFRKGEQEITGRKDETLVCYDSEEENGLYNIADKELRLLVQEIQASKPNLQFIAIFDCCHSGSLLKSDEWKNRMQPPSSTYRPLETYLEGQYKKMHMEQRELILPEINYLAMTACSPNEYALEAEEGGLFTRAMIESLKSGVVFSYADLIRQCYFMVKDVSNNRQHPSLELCGIADPYQIFLGQDSEEGKTSADVKTIAPRLETHPTTLSINFQRKENALYSHKDFDKILASPLLEDQWSIQIEAKYKVIAEGEQLCLYRIKDNQEELVIGLRGKHPLGKSWFANQLRIITKWENILAISVPDESTIAVSNIEYSFSYWKNDRIKQNHIVCNATSLTEEIPRRSIPIGDEDQGIFYQIKIQHQHRNTHGLYFYLLHLDRKYQITQKNELFAKSIYASQEAILYNSEERGKLLGISDDETNEIEDYFLLIASEEPFDSPYYFHQTGIGDYFGKIIEAQELQMSKEEMTVSEPWKKDWCIRKLSVQLIRNSNT